MKVRKPLQKDQLNANPVHRWYNSSEEMIADQENQIGSSGDNGGYLYYNGQEYWEYLGTTNGDISDYRPLAPSNCTVIPNEEKFQWDSGPKEFTLNDTPFGIPKIYLNTAYLDRTFWTINDNVITINTDIVPESQIVINYDYLDCDTIPNTGEQFVSYTKLDGRSATEQQRARQNIGLDTGIPQIINSNGTLDLINRTSNLIIFTGSGFTALTVNGMTGGLRGERVTLVNRRSNGSPVIFTEESLAVDGNNRFSIRQTVTLLQSESIVLMYDLVRWVHYKPYIQLGDNINTNPGAVLYSGANHLPGTFSGELNTAFNMEPFSSNRRLRYNGSLLTNSFSSAVRRTSLANNSTYVVPNASAQENKIFVIYIVDTTDRTRYSYGLGVLRTGDFEPVYFIKDDGNNGDRFILNPGSSSNPGIKFRNESGGVANYAYSITFLSEAL